jgi:pyruvate/2-oxoglutarate dehydrogenase complex dihydrolipoamide acyltransferase (E2) component
MCRIVAGLVASACMLTSWAFAQPPAQTPALPTPQATAAPAARVFGSDTGLVLNFIKADKTADFEAIVAKVKEALQKSANPQRKQQAASWRVFKSPDPAAGGAVLYVFIVEPVVKGADYTVSAILAEAFPDELAALYKTYSESYSSGQNFVNLSLVSELGK